jgi:rRNA maturation RNase YbeY
MAEKIQFYGKTKELGGSFRKKIRKTIDTLANDHGYIISQISYIFMSDEELNEINQTHLQHDDYTDIITFDLSDTEACIDGEIYISIERVFENAITFKTTKELELVRVICHGVLHLMGYKDKSEIDSKKMRDAENLSIEIYKRLSQ